MSVDENVLFVAVDGMDHELVQEFGCENARQAEFGLLDNHSCVENIVTSELFATFLTGKPPSEHGVRRLRRWPDDWKGSVMERASVLPRRPQGLLRRLLDTEKRTYYHDDISQETLVDEFDRVETLAFPAHDKQTIHDRIWTGLSMYDDVSLCDTDSLAEFRYRKSELFHRLGRRYDLLLCHFLRLDTIQHVFETEAHEDPSVLEPYYVMFDELLGQIRDRADNYDLIVFMSDHGLPKGDEHNRNAFYSTSEPLGLDEPDLIDLHDAILEYAGETTDDHC